LYQNDTRLYQNDTLLITFLLEALSKSLPNLVIIFAKFSDKL